MHEDLERRWGGDVAGGIAAFLKEFEDILESVLAHKVPSYYFHTNGGILQRPIHIAGFAE